MEKVYLQIPIVGGLGQARRVRAQATGRGVLANYLPLSSEGASRSTVWIRWLSKAKRETYEYTSECPENLLFPFYLQIRSHGIL